MTYGDTTRIRELAGNPDVTNVSADAILQAAEIGDSYLETFTGATGYTTSDTEYALVQAAAEHFAAAFIRKRFPDPEGKAKALEETAQQLCLVIRRGGKGIFIASPSYRTHPLNEDATPYRSLLSANNSTDDSDLS